jgi:NADPH:quinone reductase
MHAIEITQHGGPDEMRWVERPTPEPGPGQVRVRVEAAGVNFIDVYHRTGQYKVPLPYVMGQEGAGVVEAAGPGITDPPVGARVAWTGIAGSYATHVIVPALRAVLLPPAIEARTAAAVMLQGLTAHYLSHSTYALKPGDTCLVYAAAGGVGLLLTQMARLRGARVIGAVSTEEKARLAREAGADAVVLYSREDVRTALPRLTNGAGVQVVYDSVGRDTFEKSLDCLAPRGMLVLFGQSSGAVPPFDPQQLAAKGSLFLTRPRIDHYTATREELLARTGEIFGWIAEGRLQVRVGATLPFTQAAEAHRQLEGRQTVGKVLLVPPH